MYLFYLECSVGIHQISENFNIGSSDQKPGEKRSDLPQQTWNAQKSLAREMFYIMEKWGRVWAWVRFKTCCWSVSPAHFTMKWNPATHQIETAGEESGLSQLTTLDWIKKKVLHECDHPFPATQRRQLQSIKISNNL